MISIISENTGMGAIEKIKTRQSKRKGFTKLREIP